MSLAPALDEKMIWTLEVIARGLAADGTYLDGADYPEEVLALLSGRGAAGIVDEAVVEGLDVPEEIEKMFRDLKKVRDGFATSDSAEKIAYFRLAISLLEKLVALKERSLNVRRIGQFHSLVLQVLEENLEPTAITKVRTRLLELAV